ncbi:MAG TPA: response regulator transcription factor [Terriglobales bacterium]|nr:response regulator transcription factor [Terriglobales bacterium]
MRKRLAIVFADHHLVVRESVATLISKQPDMEVVGTAANAEEALALVQQRRPDLLLMEVDLPEGSSFELMRKLAQERIPVPTVILTASENEVDYVQAVRLGAGGLVLKRDNAEKLFQVIRQVAAGRLAFSNDIAQQVVNWMAGQRAKPRKTGLQRLSDREREIVLLVTRGMRNREVAAQLKISENTVKRHLQSIFIKTGAHDRVELATLAAEQNVRAA